jgi:hypothetical protein
MIDISKDVYIPVFRIAAAHNDFDNDLIRPGFRNRDILDRDFGSFGYDSFFHVGNHLFRYWIVFVFELDQSLIVPNSKLQNTQGSMTSVAGSTTALNKELDCPSIW